MRIVVFALFLVALCHQSINADTSAVDLIEDIYKSCLSQYSTSCVKPKALSWISNVVDQDHIKISDNLIIVRTDTDEFTAEQRSVDPNVELFDKIDSFLSTHAIKMRVPEILQSEEARSFIPTSYLKGGLAENLQVPLVEGNTVEGKFLFKQLSLPLSKSICNFRKGLCQESYDSIFTWFEIQNNRFSANRPCNDCFKNMEGNDFRSFIACLNRSYGHFQVCQAKSN